jgi:V/A-type H+-transporting ATPase subunit C
VKAAGAQVSGDRLLSDCGRVPADKLKAAVEEDRLSDLPADMAAAYESARSLLARTGNPQLADFELDAAYFVELMRLAEATGSEFIKGYVRTMIDSANLRAAVRTVRMGKDRDFMLTALAPGGFADRENLAAAAESGDGLAAIFASTCLEHAAALGAEAMKGGPLTDFELACDNGVSAYLSQAKTKPFGIEPAAEYLALLEGEITAARMILTGRLAGIEPEVIRERLRDINA